MIVTDFKKKSHSFIGFAMLEIEQKYKNVNHDTIKKLLEDRVDSWIDHQEADQYFNAPDRDFAQTHEAFRLRRIGASNFLTYKGPRIDPKVKIRPELEIAIRDGEQAVKEMTQLLIHLGYRPVTIVQKRRRQGQLEHLGYRVTVCLDEVETLGQFAEVEIVAAEEEMESARQALLEVAETLNLTEVEPRSYLSLVLEKEAENKHHGSSPFRTRGPIYVGRSGR